MLHAVVARRRTAYVLLLQVSDVEPVGISVANVAAWYCGAIFGDDHFKVFCSLRGKALEQVGYFAWTVVDRNDD